MDDIVRRKLDELRQDAAELDLDENWDLLRMEVTAVICREGLEAKDQVRSCLTAMKAIETRKKAIGAMPTARKERHISTIVN